MVGALDQGHPLQPRPGSFHFWPVSNGRLYSSYLCDPGRVQSEKQTPYFSTDNRTQGIGQTGVGKGKIQRGPRENTQIVAAESRA